MKKSKSKKQKQNQTSNKKKQKRANKQKAIVGKGSYATPQGPFQAIGTQLGALAGGGLGKLLGTITGLGDYEIAKNSIMGSDPPPLNNTGKPNHHSTRIQHREFIKNIYPSRQNPPVFEVSSWEINPTNQVLFPWLAGTAINYQYWRPMGIVFEFISSAGDAVNSTNIALGTVAIATNYNSNAEKPADVRHLLNMEYVCSSKPSSNLLHGVECDPKQMVLPMLYTSPNRTIPGQENDKRFESLGRINVATFGSQFNASPQVIGQLWVTYDIELIAPYLDASVALSSHIEIDPVSLTPALLFGNTSGNVVQANSNAGLTIDQPNNLVIFPLGTSAIFSVTYSVQLFNPVNWTAPTLTGINGAVAKNILDGDTISNTSITGTGGLLSCTYFFDVQDIGDGTFPAILFNPGTMVIPAAGFPLSYADLHVASVNYTS